MSREYQYDEKLVCQVCGTRGAYDIMGDCLCVDCLKAFRQAADEAKEEALQQQEVG